MRALVTLLLTVFSALGPATSIAARPGAGPTPDTPPRPVLVMPEKIKDFGVVSRGTVLKASFLVHNAGNAPLEVTDPSGSRQSPPIKKVVPAGASTTFEIKVNTTDFSGPMSKAVIIYSNDPDTPQVNLVIKFFSRAYIDVLPRPLLRFSLLQGEVASQKVVLSSDDGSAFEVTGAETGSAPYKIGFRELGEKERLPDRQGSQWEVSVTVPADTKAGLFTEKVTVKTSSAKAPDVLINVYASIQPIIQIVPERLDFGTVTDGAPVARPVILVNNRRGAQFELIKVAVDDPGFSAEAMPIQVGQRWQVVVTLKPAATKGEHRGTLSITTNDPVFALIAVPVRAVVQ